MAKEIYYQHNDLNDDGINETICVYCRDWTIPLIGDYRGVELARIRYIPGRPESVAYAERIANDIVVSQGFSGGNRRSGWRWFGNAGHFIGSPWCRFHMTTQVGAYLVSTVGEYFPPHGMDLDNDMSNIGDKRKYETMVFHAGEPCACGCGLPQIDGVELDGVGYNNAKDATEGHDFMCIKWASQDDVNQPESVAQAAFDAQTAGDHDDALRTAAHPLDQLAILTAWLAEHRPDMLSWGRKNDLNAVEVAIGLLEASSFRRHVGDGQLRLEFRSITLSEELERVICNLRNALHDIDDILLRINQVQS